MRKIKLMPDYHCYPLWEQSDHVVGNIDPASLPIPEALVKDLLTWAQTFDATLNMDDPLRSGFPDIEQEAAFKEQGRILQQRLAQALGADYLVSLSL